ncbi:UNVERIFIED_CONTAM: hypothetical protein RMT77_012614 [Armadillidium vulgare]
MNISSENAVIEKCIFIDNFNTYSPMQKEILDTSLCIEEFNSKWKIHVYPRFPINPQNESSVYCDVYINLVCEECSAASNLCKNIKISSMVKGRESYPTLCELDTSEVKPTWTCTIISHVTLQSLKLVKDNRLQFNLQFNFPAEVLTKCIDGRNNLIHNMEDLFKDPHYFDTCLISSSEEKFYVHASVLQSRSNILKTGKVLSLSKHHEHHEVSMQDDDEVINSHSDINLTDKSAFTNNDYSQSNSSHTTSAIDKYISSPAKQPLFTVSSNISASKSTKSTDSPSFYSPKKSRKISSSVTPKKKSETVNSPSGKVGQMQLTQFFPRSSSLNVKSESGASLSFVPFSPIKGGTPSKHSKPETPLIKSLKENNETPSKQNHSYSLNNDIRSPCGIIPRQNGQILKRKLFDDEVEHSRTLTVIKLNISTSVLQELLRWIYTGKSNSLGELSRPLLVAAKRHNIQDLFESTQLHLASMITVDNVSELLALGHKYKAGILKGEAMQFAVSQASEVTLMSSWGNLSLQYPEILLEFSKKLAVYKE